MALAATMIWEIRSSATAANANGGGFNPSRAGTDYTLQDAAQYSGSNLSATTATTSPVISSATHTFVTADEGNIINITAGTNWTVGRYEIVSTSGGNATLDRACASVASPTSGTFAVGGALSLGNANDATTLSAVVNGNKVWIKNGSYAPGSSINLLNSNTGTSVNVIEGYNATRGDAPTGATRPLLTFAGTNSLTFPQQWELYNVQVSGGGTSVVIMGAGGKIINCKVTNTSTTANRNGINMGTNCFVTRCEAVSYRGQAVQTGTGAFVSDCYLHDSNFGFDVGAAASNVSLINSIVEGCVTAAVRNSSTSQVTIYGNTLYGAESKLGIGIQVVTSVYNIRALNNLIYGFATGISHADSQTVSYDAYNNFYNNTADVSNWTKGASDLALDPSFTSATQIRGTAATTSGSVLTDGSKDFSSVVDNQDFCYIESGTGVTAGKYKITAHTTTTITLDIAPGTSATADKVYQVTLGHDFNVAVALKASASTGVFPGGLTTGYRDIGGVQRKEPEFSSDPGESNVRSGTTYYDLGVLRTGLLVVPTAAQVKTGVAFDTASTGTYDGSDRWTDPGEANVRLSTAYKANSTTNNKTGTLDLPAESDVSAGVDYDNGTQTGTAAGVDLTEVNAKLDLIKALVNGVSAQVS